MSSHTLDHSNNSPEPSIQLHRRIPIVESSSSEDTDPVIDLSSVSTYCYSQQSCPTPDTPEMPKKTKLLEPYIETPNVQSTDIQVSHLSPDQKRVWDGLNCSFRNMFVTGSAGSGKSFLMRCIRRNFKHPSFKWAPNRIIVTAPTGVAALNVQGSTIHSFFGPKFAQHDNPKEIEAAMLIENRIELQYERVLLIIDEISMKVFGGVRLLIFGDFLQLPPADEHTTYVFKSKLWEDCNFQYFTLTHAHRQNNDTKFYNFLQSIRFGGLTDKSPNNIKLWSSLYYELFSRTINFNENPLFDHTVLAARRRQVETYHNFFLKKKRNEIVKINAIDSCTDQSSKEELDKMIESQISVCIGIPMMFRINFLSDGICNGTIGIISQINYDEKDNTKVSTICITVNKETITLERHKFEHCIVSQNKKRIIATRKQFPISSGTCFTIHKSQGLTLAKVIIDLYKIFDYNQLYVALSRCKSFDDFKIVNLPCTFPPITKELLDFQNNVSAMSDPVVPPLRPSIISNDVENKTVIPELPPPLTPLKNKFLPPLTPLKSLSPLTPAKKNDLNNTIIPKLTPLKALKPQSLPPLKKKRLDNDEKRCLYEKEVYQLQSIVEMVDDRLKNEAKSKLEEFLKKFDVLK
ncbi:hypothetical protein RCL1_001658 [Eukaryota sp. TZLM3-RCL]